MFSTISVNGRYIAFESSANTLVLGDNNGSADIFLHDVLANPSNNVINGPVNNDSLTGTTRNDLIRGLGGNDLIKAMAGNDIVNGGEGNDTIDGGAGFDLIKGGAGDDNYYIVDDSSDMILEFFNGGIDTVNSNVSYTLPQGVENLVLTGENSVRGIGNYLDNQIIGNSGNNRLEGIGGRDTLIGGLGNDILIGNNNDSDRFRFNSPTEGRDLIPDFTLNYYLQDYIEVKAEAFNIPTGPLDSSGLSVGTSATSPNHRFIYNSTTGILSFDQDGNGSLAAVQLASLPASLNLSSSNIIGI